MDSAAELAPSALKSALKKTSKYSSASNKRSRDSSSSHPKISISRFEQIHEYEQDETLDEMISDIHHIQITLNTFFKKPIMEFIKEAGMYGRAKREPGKEDEIDDQDIYRSIHRVLKPYVKSELARFQRAYTETLNTEVFKNLSPEEQEAFKNAEEAKFTEIKNYNSNEYVIRVAKEIVNRGKYTSQVILQEYFKIPEENKTPLLKHLIFVLLHLGLPDILKFKNFCKNKCHRVAKYIKTHTIPENLHEYPSNAAGQNLLSECQALVNFIKLSLRIVDVELFDRLLREVTDNRCTFLKNNEYTSEYFARVKENDRRFKEARAAQKRTAAEAAKTTPSNT
jgi:hypothetical protein